MRAHKALIALGAAVLALAVSLPGGFAPLRTRFLAPAPTPPPVGAGAPLPVAAHPTVARGMGAATLAPGPVGPPVRFAPIAGTVYRYRVEVTQRTGLQADGVGQAAAFRLFGDLAVRVRAGPEAPIVLDHDFAGLHARADEAPVALPSGISLRLDGRGRLQAAQLLPDKASPDGRNLARALATLLQATLPSPTASHWEAQEQDLAGGCLARYQVGPGGVVIKTRSWPTLAAEAEGVLQFGLRADGMIESLAGTEIVRTELAPVALVSQLEVSVHLGAVEPQAEAHSPRPPMDGSWESVLVAEAPEPVRGPTPDLLPVLLGLERAHHGGRWEDEAPRGFLQLARLLVANDAAVAEALEALLRGRLPEPVAKALVEALGEAGTPAAQEALLACMDEPACARLAPLACLCLGEAALPLSATVRHLEETAGSKDEDLRQGAVLGLGTMAARTGDAALADRLAGRLEGLLAADPGEVTGVEALLVALGNAGRPRSLAAIAPYLDSPDLALRVAAVGAIRRLPGQAAWGQLAAAARGDQEPAVRREAILSLAGRSEPEVDALLGAVLAEDPAALVRLAALEEAVGRGLVGPVAQVARLDPDPEVRAAAALACQSHAAGRQEPVTK